MSASPGARNWPMVAVNTLGIGILIESGSHVEGLAVEEEASIGGGELAKPESGWAAVGPDPSSPGYSAPANRG